MAFNTATAHRASPSFSIRVRAVSLRYPAGRPPAPHVFEGALLFRRFASGKAGTSQATRPSFGMSLSRYATKSPASSICWRVPHHLFSSRTFPGQTWLIIFLMMTGSTWTGLFMYFMTKCSSRSGMSSGRSRRGGIRSGKAQSL